MFATSRFAECNDSVKGYVSVDELVEIIYKVKNYKDDKNGGVLNERSRIDEKRNMLEDVVSKGKVSEVDKAFIDMTHRNTELLEENQKLKEKVRAVNKGLRKVQERSIKYKNRCFK